MKRIYKIFRGAAVSRFWFAGWFYSPKNTTKREEYWLRLERTYIALNKQANSAIPGTQWEPNR